MLLAPRLFGLPAYLHTLGRPGHPARHPVELVGLELGSDLSLERLHIRIVLGRLVRPTGGDDGAQVFGQPYSTFHRSWTGNR
jgi:hypothetical protein